jgi:hypothetical protein
MAVNKAEVLKSLEGVKDPAGRPLAGSAAV